MARRQQQTKTRRKPQKPAGKVRVIPLGGLGEIGKNMTVVEYEQDMIVIDCGIGFPDEEMPGIDFVIPDFSYLEANKDRIRGVFLTHGHEDHIGGVPYLLRNLNLTVYGTPLTLGILRGKLEEQPLPWQADLKTVKPGDKIRAGAMTVEFIHVNHSIADACAFAIHTPLGVLIHTGDFKLDTTPIEGEMMDLVRLGELGKQGVLLLMCESTNAERPGYTPSEKKVGASLEYIFTTHTKKRIIIATFSSNVHRVQQIINTSARHKRKVAITGRSMINIVNAAVELGYMKVPNGVLVDINEIKRYKPSELTLITTGSQGEPMSALYRMAFSDHAQVSLDANDVVVLSSSAIPGNEKLVGRIINELSRNEVEVLHDAFVEVHVSGHACQEELKLMQALTKPKYFMPVHGENRHLSANRELAKYLGMNDRNIFISEIGKVLEIDASGARWSGTVPAGKVLVDGYGVGDVGNIVLNDRLHLAQDGLIVVVATMDCSARLLLSGPDLISRGFVFVRESEDLMEGAKRVAENTIDDVLTFSRRREPIDRMLLKRRIKDDLAKYLYQKTKRKPMILPVIMDI
ncbi:MAG: ribonuclease J [Ruminococcaceae bacterium]|nr:ribonuclease J [Oscillospiraceae bacterium]